MKPTVEQQDILDAYRSGGDLVIKAFAGTGKTTSLKMLAEATDPGRRMLYLAYNKSVQVDAESKFPKSTECRTAHSLAYRAVGYRYRARMNGPRMTMRDVAKALKLPAIEVNDQYLSPAMSARLVMDTVDRFCKTTDTVISGKHFVWDLNAPGITADTIGTIANRLYPEAQRVWNDLVKADGKLPFQPDHYLKIWQLSNPSLDYDVVCMDEAQDADPLISQIVMASQGQRIVVGDPFQAIYGWRGAQDSLEKFTGTQLSLSQSFRFGPQIATEANKWLSHLNSRTAVKGYAPIQSVVMTVKTPDAVLCRTNGGVIKSAIEMMDAGRRPRVEGSVKAFEIMARAASQLQQTGRTDHRELCLFTGWSEVQEYSETKEGADLRVFVNLVDKYTADGLLSVAKRIEQITNPNVTVSTVHKAKGLEWDTVRIGSDFREPGPSRYSGGEWVPCEKVNEAYTHRPRDVCERLIPATEARLAYVAVTRAINTLDRTGVEFVDTLDGLTYTPKAAA